MKREMEKEKNIMIIIIYEGEFLNGNYWNGIGYDYDGNKIFEIKDGKGYVKEYEHYHLIYEVNIYMVKEMVEEKNIITMII